ncbi:hypothetical protein DVH24_003750 [Malus domestica]|uniref:Myb/SANT-like domain-containing protein n=1 Tax=Malus domestica TaxID=3750 RepID=A0A498IMP0_MALDO|nr:hypothetical protein DVH24_003750 [Malus domestica]
MKGPDSFRFADLFYPSTVGSSEAPTKHGNYSIEEDVALCRAYIMINEDPIIGNGQALTTFWKHVVVVFNKIMIDIGEERTPRSLKSRWYITINAKSNKFNEVARCSHIGIPLYCKVIFVLFCPKIHVSPCDYFWLHNRRMSYHTLVVPITITLHHLVLLSLSLSLPLVPATPENRKKDSGEIFQSLDETTTGVGTPISGDFQENFQPKHGELAGILLDMVSRSISEEFTID